MHRLRSIAVLLLFLSVAVVPQQPMSWKRTNFNYTAYASRVNDNFFLTPHLGWAVNGIGQIHKTTDGGVTWTKLLDKTNMTHFRSVGFFDSLNGYAGALGWGDSLGHPNDSKDTVILYRTTNGGTSWNPVSSLTSSTIRRGFCGMQVFNDSIIYAVGRVRGPAWFYKTTDRGATWTAKDMNGYAAGLIDVRFFSKDTGLIVGLTHITHELSRAIILGTTDGGESWDTVYVSTRTNEWAWKLNFPSRKIGYVSLQRNNSVAPVFILKTTDGGTTWNQKLFSSTGYFVQGVGFINDTLGWAGGTSLAPKQTTDGGETWTSFAIGNSLNRFRKINDSLMYVSGAGIWKYSPGTSLGVRSSNSAPAAAGLLQNFPNPFNPRTSIEFSVPEDGLATIGIYDITGRLVRTVFSDVVKKGTFTVSWDGYDDGDDPVASGTYFYRLETKNFTQTKKMSLIR